MQNDVNSPKPSKGSGLLSTIIFVVLSLIFILVVSKLMG